MDKIEYSFYTNPEIYHNTKCGGPDSNRRIPTETDLESVAFNLARQPPLSYPDCMRELNSFIIC